MIFLLCLLGYVLVILATAGVLSVVEWVRDRRHPLRRAGAVELRDLGHFAGWSVDETWSER